MAFDNLCSTKLSLSLVSDVKNIHLNPHHKNKTSQRFDLDDHHLSFPSLTLGLPNDLHGINRLDIAVKGGETCNNIHVDASQGSAASCFSNGSVKREREVSVEDVEVDRECPKVCDDQDEEGPRKKLRLSKEQALVLEDSFKEHSSLNPKQKHALANMLNLRPRQVEVWFQNRRARTKLKQTETDCEIWKKCCESLREENRRLHKELRHLKASKQTTPYYMQLPATTLNMCPSCHRVGAAAVEKSSKLSFPLGANPHFYSPFTHPSAAC